MEHHIYEMESILNKAVEKMDALEKMIAEYKDFQPEIRKLEAYYTGKKILPWMRPANSRRN